MELYTYMIFYDHIIFLFYIINYHQASNKIKLSVQYGTTIETLKKKLAHHGIRTRAF